MALISSKLHLLVVFSFLPCIIFAQNAWLYPDTKTNPTYNYIDILNASWTTIFESPNLILWCTASGDGAYGPQYNLSVPPIGNRLFHLNFSETAPEACHFNIGAKKDFAKNNLNSAQFTIQIESSSSTVTWSPTNPSSSGTSSSTTGSLVSQTPTPAASTSPPLPSTEKSSTTGSAASQTFSSAASTSAVPPSSGLSPAAKAGIGIGAAAGVIALVSGLLFWVRNRKRWRLTQLGKYDNSMQEQPGYQASEMPASGTHTVPVETDGNTVHHEMSGTSMAQAKFIEELEGSGTTGGPIGEAR